VDKTIKKVLEQIDREEIVDFIKDLVRVETVETEAPIIPVIKGKMEQIGMDVELYETFDSRYPDKLRPCILGTLHGKNGKNKSPVLMFNGHTDVVPVEFPEKWTHPPFEPVVDGERLYGRGTADMKGGLGSMLMAAQAIVKAGVELSGTLVVAAVPGEETGGWGSESTIKRKDWDAVVIGEPTNMKINPACNGISTFWVKVTGKSAHASMPEKGINAIDKMLKVMNAFETYKEELEKRVHPLSGTPAFVSCIINGGWRGVIVADECRLHITTHMIPGETIESRYREVSEILEDLMKNDPDLNAELLDWEGKKITLPLPKTGKDRARLDPTEISKEEPVFQAMIAGSEEVLGRALPVGGSRYACDSPFYVNDANIPALIFGPGSIDQAHTYDEWIDIRQLVDVTGVYAVGAMKFLGY
jgi:acetylornithine deacetylase/succinyl-diaminopimelate desuccinylase family protein